MRVACGGRDRGVCGIGVDREEVERKLGEAACPEGSAEILDEPCRGVRGPGAARIVAATGRQRAADHGHVRGRRLDRAGRPSRAGRKYAMAAAASAPFTPGLELGHPEQVGIGLVPEADQPELRDPAQDRRRVGAELDPVRGRYRRVAGERVDGDDRPDPELPGAVDRRAQPLELGVVGSRLGPAPDGAEHDRPEARRGAPARMFPASGRSTWPRPRRRPRSVGEGRLPARSGASPPPPHSPGRARPPRSRSDA